MAMRGMRLEPVMLGRKIAFHAAARGREEQGRVNQMHTVPPKSEAALQRHVILLSSTNADPRLLGGEGRQMHAEARELTSLGGSLDAATEPIDEIGRAHV